MSFYKVKMVVVLGLFLSGVLSSWQISAAPTVEDEVKFRQSGMMFMRWNMGKIKKQVIKKPDAFDQDKVIAAARVIASIANSDMGVLYKKESLGVKGWKQSRLKVEYFEQGKKVRSLTTDFINEANKLVLVAKKGEPTGIKRQFNAVFQSCKSCHKAFRSK